MYATICIGEIITDCQDHQGKTEAEADAQHSPRITIRWSLQLKGCGRTPYSRFADGKLPFPQAVREFLFCEALTALDIPTVRSLSLVL